MLCSKDTSRVLESRATAESRLAGLKAFLCTGEYRRIPKQEGTSSSTPCARDRVLNPDSHGKVQTSRV